MFEKVDNKFIEFFRQPGNANNRLAAWDPYDKTMRYFKFLLFHQLQAKDSAFYSNYQKIGPVSLGNPVFLKSRGLEINLDHLLSVEEFMFLEANMPLGEVKNVLEIGAGFGRTAQALLSLSDDIESYTIIDLPEVLILSREYLKNVFGGGGKFHKLRFVDALSFETKGYELHPDLVINIDSFQEMTKDTIDFYYRELIEGANFFFSKNAVGKYSPESVGIFGVEENQLHDVFSLGLSTEVIDIFDNTELELARARHVERYRPRGSFVVAQAPLGIFPYYHNVLYGKVRGKCMP